MGLPRSPDERHRKIAALFSERVGNAAAWDVPAPVPGWTARDVVGHLIDWLPGFLAAGSDLQFGTGPSVDDDPVAAWRLQAEAVQQILDDPLVSGEQFSNPHIGTMPLARAIDRFYTTDVFMHTWDLARATGQDDRLDADTCADLLVGMEQMEDVMRASGQFGPRIAVPVGSDPQTGMLGFIGRDPDWTRPDVR